jgi:hypothetical protein
MEGAGLARKHLDGEGPVILEQRHSKRRKHVASVSPAAGDFVADTVSSLWDGGIPGLTGQRQLPLGNTAAEDCFGKSC